MSKYLQMKLSQTISVNHTQSLVHRLNSYCFLIRTSPQICMIHELNILWFKHNETIPYFHLSLQVFWEMEQASKYFYRSLYCTKLHCWNHFYLSLHLYTHVHLYETMQANLDNAEHFSGCWYIFCVFLHYINTSFGVWFTENSITWSYLSSIRIHYW